MNFAELAEEATRRTAGVDRGARPGMRATWAARPARRRAPGHPEPAQQLDGDAFADRRSRGLRRASASRAVGRQQDAARVHRLGRRLLGVIGAPHTTGPTSNSADIGYAARQIALGSVQQRGQQRRPHQLVVGGDGVLDGDRLRRADRADSPSGASQPRGTKPQLTISCRPSAARRSRARSASACGAGRGAPLARGRRVGALSYPTRRMTSSTRSCSIGDVGPEARKTATSRSSGAGCRVRWRCRCCQLRAAWASGISNPARRVNPANESDTRAGST